MKSVYFCSLLCGASILSANPQDPLVIQGNVDIQKNGKELSVTASDRSIIHWKEFSIAPHETTTFIQPHSQATVLNRVTGNFATEILGTLKANGHLFLINPRGLLIGEGAAVDTAAFVGSTLDLSDHDFMEKKELLFRGNSSHEIINLGKICTWDGDLLLLAKQVKNEGVLEAPHGVISLAAGAEVLIKPLGQERIYIRPQRDKQEAIISNSGDISALQVELKADGNPYALAIKQSGRVQATGIEERQGRVFLVAERGGVHIKGDTQADSQIKVSANHLVLGDEAAGKGSLIVEGEKPGHITLQAKEVITQHSGHALFGKDASFTLESGGDINIYGHVKMQGASSIALHAENDVRIGNGTQALHSRLESQGPMTLLAGRDLFITASEQKSAHIATQSPTSSISISAGQDVVLLGGDASPARAYIFSKNNLSIIAGRHLILDSTGEGYAAVGAVEDVTVVVDNLFSTPPLVGPGALRMGRNTRMQGKTLRLFTVNQAQNSLEGVLNLAPFTPGAENTVSNEEVWGTYFFSSSGGVPFTIFYKNVKLTARITDLFIIATTEFFQDMKDFDEFFYVQRHFLLGYDAKAHTKLRSFRMLRKTYKNSCGEIRELL